jgi:hypothetical protein
MQIDRCSAAQISAIVWKWEWIKDFPAELCKQLLHQGHGYWVGWATISSADEFLALQLRDHDASKCLTPPGESHRLRDIIDRMNAKGWTFEKLADDALDLGNVKRDINWFKKLLDLDRKFEVAKMGPLALHPREGLKERAPALEALEVYEGLHRALVLAQRLLSRRVEMPELRLIYLYPDRPTGRGRN